MMTEAAEIAARLDALARDVRALAEGRDDDDGRYLASSAALVGREHAKLVPTVAAGDRVATAWALRSVADMMKGLIDIGADLPRSAPHLWEEASDLAARAHAAERAARPS